jgi:hypothetical protein
MSAHVEPALGKPSFSCPCCGTLAHQTWFHVCAREYAKDNQPSMLQSDIVEQIEKNPNLDKNQKIDLQAWAKRILATRNLH